MKKDCGLKGIYHGISSETLLKFLCLYLKNLCNTLAALRYVLNAAIVAIIAQRSSLSTNYMHSIRAVLQRAIIATVASDRRWFQIVARLGGEYNRIR